MQQTVESQTKDIALKEGGAFSIDQFCDWASIKRTKYYELVSSSEIVPRRIGGKPVILVSEAKSWLNSLPVAA